MMDREHRELIEAARALGAEAAARDAVWRTVAHECMARTGIPPCPGEVPDLLRAFVRGYRAALLGDRS